MLVLVEQAFNSSGEEISTLQHLIREDEELEAFKAVRMERLLTDSRTMSVKFFVAQPVEVGHYKKDWNVAYDVEKELDDIPF